MEENKDGVQKDEYQVIQEKIVPKKKNTWKWWGKALLRVGVSALVFGVVAGAALVLSGKVLIEKLGLENVFRQVVGIGNVTPSPSLTKAPAPTPNSMPTVPVSLTSTPTPRFEIEPPEITSGISVSIGGGDAKKPEKDTAGDETVRDFLNMYSGIAKKAEELKKSLVQITAITEGVDWFEESYETTENAAGLYVGDNGIDMLFLVNLDQIEGATKFSVTFANGDTLPCSIFAYDTNYRLAVLAIRLSEAAAMEEAKRPVKAQFALEAVETGTPVMVLGNPNGHMGAMELGMITGVGQVVQVIDDEVSYFTTGITEYAEGDGFVFNLSGEVIGIVSNTLNQGEKGVITAAMVSGMRKVIEDTLNNVPRIYCGMRLKSVETVMGGKYKLPDGIYVTEVLPGSPAMYAGIKNGDIITKVGITEITGVRQFYEEISAVGVQSVRIIVSRETRGEYKEQTLYMLPEARLH